MFYHGFRSPSHVLHALLANVFYIPAHLQPQRNSPDLLRPQCTRLSLITVNLSDCHQKIVSNAVWGKLSKYTMPMLY